MIKNIVIFLILTIIISGCGYKTKPIYLPKNSKVVTK